MLCGINSCPSLFTLQFFGTALIIINNSKIDTDGLMLSSHAPLLVESRRRKIQKGLYFTPCYHGESWDYSHEFQMSAHPRVISLFLSQTEGEKGLQFKQ